MEGYFEIFESNYTNNANDNFKIIIWSKNERPKENISAFADLSYKDVDNILEPIRGSQLDITVNASIERPFDLFLDFKEKDFLAELYRNDVLIFKGFINPEGVTQSFTSQFWQSQLTAVDNIASLENISLPYKKELPSEFVLLDMCLKQTGLDLPIAFFDDINQKAVTQNGIVYSYNRGINRGDKERIVDPLVFKNDNDRFVSCKKVINDILQKYNAVLVQQSIEHDNGTDLCWVFFRPAIFYKNYSTITNPQYRILRITGFETKSQNGFENTDFPIIEQLGRANPKTYLLSTFGGSKNNIYFKNKNQLIRQNRALQNFRFTQNWIEKDSQFVYSYDFFTIQQQGLESFVIESNDNELVFQSYTSSVLIAVSNEIKLQEEASNLILNGKGLMKKIDNINLGLSMNLEVSHTAPNGNVSVLYNFIEDGEIVGLEWRETGGVVINDDIVKLFRVVGDHSDEFNVNFDIELPALPSRGGTIKIFLSTLFAEDSAGQVRQYEYTLNELNLKSIPPDSLGEGEFHDALNNQRISSKLDNPVEVINADETSDFFRNGIKLLPFNTQQKAENYEFWTSDYDLVGKERLLELTSIERIRLFAKSQNIFSGDVGNYIPYFGRINNIAFPGLFFMFTKYIYRTADNTIESEIREIGLGNPSVTYENSIIFEDEENRLIDERN